jgi:hypothetical protein
VASRDSNFRIAERAIGVILLATSIVIAIFDPNWVGKIAIPVIWVVLVVGCIAAGRRGRR